MRSSVANKVKAVLLLCMGRVVMIKDEEVCSYCGAEDPVELYDCENCGYAICDDCLSEEFEDIAVCKDCEDEYEV